MTDFVSLEDAKSWLAIKDTSTGADDMLSGLISSVNQFVSNYLGYESIYPTDFTERIDGVRFKGRIVLNNYPVIYVSSLIIDGRLINPVSDENNPTNGYLLSVPVRRTGGSRQYIDLFGHLALPCRQNIVVKYRSGYQLTGEVGIVTNAGTYTVKAPYGAWKTDEGVIDQAADKSFIRVDASPLASQYSVSNGVYTFNAADISKSLKFNYGYCPYDIQQAAREMIAERYKYKDRIGINSTSLSGKETTSYSNFSITEAAKSMLRPYRRMF